MPLEKYLVVDKLIIASTKIDGELAVFNNNYFNTNSIYHIF